VLQDPALAFELLRAVNTAEVRGAVIAGSGPILTLRRAIAMVGLDGVRRAALSLRDWPGPLNDANARALQVTIERAQRAARIAQLIRPSGYDGEVIYLIALLQNLGRLVTRYHFPDEAAQIERLMQPVAAEEEGQPDEPGMSEENASVAVLGVEIEAFGAAVARHWGLSEDVLHMVRRLPADATVRKPDSDAEVLRLTASAANEAVDAMQLQPPAKAAAAIGQVAQRYARVLGITTRDVNDALQAARERLLHGAAEIHSVGESERASAPSR